MSRRDAAPTHGWIISSKINKYLALVFVLLVLAVFISTWAVRYSLDRDCTNVYHRDLRILHYWINVQAGSTKLSCPQPLQ